MGRHLEYALHKPSRGGGGRGRRPGGQTQRLRLRGQIEARLTPFVLRGVYRRCLRRLNAIVAPAQQF